MTDLFFEQPVLNSPYERPSRHWELDETGQPTQQIVESRRQASFISAVPTSKKQRGSSANQASFVFDKAARELETDNQQYELMQTINGFASRLTAGATCRIRANGR